ncbi:MAG: SDR family NAD(P)-dependent oxidoreductase, partial [Arenimonas sp.]
MKRVQDKVCIITGAALGIGRACAQRLADEGARVAIFDVDDQAGHLLLEQLRARSVDADFWHVDVSREAQVRAAIEGVAERFGGVDVLVNNAGVAGANKPTHELT